MDYKYNALEIVSAASKRFTKPLDADPGKIAVHIEITNEPAECYKIEFERGRFSISKGPRAESGGQDISTQMTVLAEEQANLGKVLVYSGENKAAEFATLDQYWDSVFKTG